MELKNIYTSIAFFLFIVMNIPYETTVPYTDTEFYTIEEPYIDYNYDNYTVVEPYIEELPLDYIILDARHDSSVSSSPSYAWVTITNNDTAGGNFSVDFHITGKGKTYLQIATLSSKGNFIPAGGTLTVKVSYNETIEGFKYDIIPPVKEVLKYKNVTRERIGTKYRKIQKSREVIKQKNESISVLQRIYRSQLMNR